MGPLAGTRILDLTSVVMGPSATQMLGDMGADVVKVEPPEGDVVRQIGPQRNAGMGAYFLNANRNKRSICLNLKDPAGRDALLRLADTADILTYNIRPQAMARLGLDYDTLAARNPRLIYAGLFGFGQDGPYAARPAYDDLIQGASVMSALIAQAGDGTPRYVPSAVADRVVGLAAVGAICATLVNRNQTGLGQRVDIPMFETMVGFVLGDHLGGLTFDPPLDGGGYARQLSPERRPYRTRDGHICAVIYNDKQWGNFLRAIGREDLPRDDPRFATYANRQSNVDFVYGELGRIFAERTTAEWMELLDRADVPAMPMHDFDSIFDDPHLKQTGFFETVEHPTEGRVRSMRLSARWSRTPVATRRLAPRQGQDGAAILREAGFADDEIAALAERRALTIPAETAGSDT